MTTDQLDRPGGLPDLSESHVRNISLGTALSTLAPEVRQVLILKYQGGMTCSEIAEALSRPIGTIRSWLVRAHAKLRSELPEFLKE
jgi:RNA polymerase sigma-70 factor (ECF subfamily)